MATFFERNKFGFIGGLLGGILGYAYYHFIGCDSGSCAITSRPFNSTLYGVLMGYLLLSFLDKNEKKENQCLS
ncbi:DUF6132 family protein [Bergeyella sp. RCAD1439]|uniref:DUF6132 family protein n=1 Tax=Bergeyella anatis TaxID=3113737 RepID=UPI002E17C438|nr:DUF6132 family protein [Bergeyella sp. RCAD1439]